MLEPSAERSLCSGVVATLVAAVVMVALPADVQAQDPSSVSDDPGGIDAQTFRPAGGPGGLIQVEGADTADHLQAYASLYLDVFSDPVVLRFEDRRQSVIDRRLNAHLTAGLGVGERFQFELGMPVALLNRGEYRDRPIDGLGPADLESRARATIVSSLEAPVGLGATLHLSAPTGRADVFRGASTPTATPGLVADTRFQTPAGPVIVATNVGMRLQGTRAVHDLEVGPTIRWGTGAELELTPDRWTIGADIFGSLGLTDRRQETSPVEFVAATGIRFNDALKGTVGGGAGIVGGVGSPDWRGLIGIEYAPEIGAADPDVEPPVPVDEGDVSEADCPPKPEGFDGPYDDDGCPVTPETFTGCDDLDDDWEGAVDEWGCPILDSDGDGVLVWDDDCPHQPVEFIGDDIPDGCPDYDISGDGVLNVDDHCPYQAGLRAYDGCPPPEDEKAAERVDDEEISLEKRIHFESDKAIIEEESHVLLEEVAMVIRAHSDVLLVEIAGHTDDRGAADYNMMLSEERAKAVREFLIERGNVNPARLVAEGYGQQEPVVDEETDEARAQNRRVEFRIVETGEEGDAEQIAPIEGTDIE